MHLSSPRPLVANGTSHVAAALSFSVQLQPQAILGKAAVAGIAFQRTRLEGPAFEQRPIATGQIMHIECGLVIRSIGYRRVELP